MSKITWVVIVVVVLGGAGWLIQQHFNKELSLSEYQCLQTVFEKERANIFAVQQSGQKKQEELLLKELEILKKTITSLDAELEEDRKELKDLDGKIAGIQKEISSAAGKVRTPKPVKETSSSELKRKKLKNRISFLQQRRLEEKKRKEDAENDLRELEARYHGKRKGHYVLKNNKRKFVSYEKKPSYFEYNELSLRYTGIIRDAQENIEKIDRAAAKLQDELAELTTVQAKRDDVPVFMKGRQKKDTLSAQLKELRYRRNGVEKDIEQQESVLLKKKKAMQDLNAKLDQQKKNSDNAISYEVRKKYALVESFLFLNSFPANRNARTFLEMYRAMLSAQLEHECIEDVINYLELHDPALKQICLSREFNRRNSALLRQYKLQRSSQKRTLLEISPKNSKTVDALFFKLSRTESAK